MAVVSAVCSVGCSIQMQHGAKEVPYDFSDYAYYDKPFATSPSYAAAPPLAAVASNPSFVPAKAELAREPARSAAEMTAVPDTAGMSRARPSKAAAFAAYAASELATPGNATNK